MNYFNWLEQERNLTNAALTVRAQAVPVNDNGRLKWPIFFPRQNVDSVELHEITTIQFRPVGERREWNAPGRKIALKTPNLRDISIIPIESNHTVEEYELQRLAERALGPNSSRFRQIISADVPDRVVFLTAANYRRIEVDAFNAWANGELTVRHPQTPSKTYVVSLGFDTDRYQTASTAWNNGGVNAFNELISWLRDVTSLVGAIQGVMLRTATLDAILVDAPNPLSMNSAVSPTISQVEQRIRDTVPGAGAFAFIVNEDTVDVFSGAGQATTKTYVWPQHKVAAIPAGDGTVGSTAFAPVVRAMQIAGGPDAQGAPIDVNGMTAYRTVKNDGRELSVDVQVNAMPIPNEQNVAVIDAGV